MFLLGILSILQITILPGLLFLLAFPFRKTLSQEIAYTYIISFFLNYIIACALTFFQIFVPITIYFIILVEILLIGHLYWKSNASTEGIIVEIPRPTSGRISKLIWGVCMACGVLSIIIFFGYAMKNVGTIFTYADEIGSYNYWAVQWTQNRMPSAFDTMGYPIAVSANWAIGYLLVGDPSIQFFNKIATSFFPVMAALSFWSLAIKTKKLSPLLASFLFFVLLRAYTPLFIGSGPLDVVIACIAVGVLVAALEYAEEPENLNKLITLQFLIASAASIKQSGLILSGVTTVFVLLTVWKKVPSSPRRIKLSLVALLLFLVLTLSWYIRIQYMIYQGLATSESAYLIRGIHGGATYFERFIKAIQMLVIGNPIISFVTIKLIVITSFLLFSILGCQHRMIRILTLLIGVPYFILWAFLFSYEPRTLAPVFPILALAAAFGMIKLIKLYVPNIEFSSLQLVITTRKRANIVAAVIGITIPVSAVAQLVYFTSERLSQKQLELQKQVIDQDLNNKLYALNDIEPFSGKIASIYGTLKFLPNLSQYYFQLRAPATLELLKYVEEREDIHYLLISIDPDIITYSFPLTDAEALIHIEKRLKDNAYRIKFRHNNLAFIKIR